MVKSKKRRFPLGLIFAIVAILLALSLIIFKLNKFFKNSDYFKIKEIIVKDAKVNLSYLEGENIFTVNLRKDSQYILNSHPQYRLVKMVRILPNRLYVEFVEREPLAIVKLYRDFCVDEEYVFFTPAKELDKDTLPLITGLETKIFGPKLQNKYDSEEVRVAVKIIKEVKGNKALEDYAVRKIDVRDLREISLVILKNLEVKLSKNDIENKILLLANLLVNLKKDLEKIKYIDLRFSNPVIKYR